MNKTCILGIETSCDETGVALLTVETDSNKTKFSHILHGERLASQINLHNDYGGVVPELASREHMRCLLSLTEDLFLKTSMKKNDLSGIAVTAGPGLNGALLIGTSFASGLGAALGLPVIPINHLEGHILAGFLDKKNEFSNDSFPFLVLLISGGHTQLISANKLGDYTIIGESIDDAVGEALDKTSQLMELGYPGGPQIEKYAQLGDDKKFKLPKPLCNRDTLNFSFSGLKTAVLMEIKKNEFNKNQMFKHDLAASLQNTITDILLIKTRSAIKKTNYKRIVVTGGVAANKLIKKRLTDLAKELDVKIYIPPQNLCTDNGLMIAWAASLKIICDNHNIKAQEELVVSPRWSISDL